MIDFFLFIFTQFYNMIMFLDEIKIYNSLSLLRILIISFLFGFAWKFLIDKKGKD